MRLTAFRRCLLIAIVFAGLSSVPCTAQRGMASRDELRGLYGVENWPGKGGPIRNGFRVTPEIIPHGFSLSTGIWPFPSMDTKTGEIYVRRDYDLSLTGGAAPSARVAVIVAESCAEAQEQLFYSLVNVSRGQPPLTPRGSDHGLFLGDVCYCSPHGETFWSIAWVRSNVMVSLDARDDRMKPFLAGIARAIDAAIARRSTSKSYRLSPCRPIIDKVTHRHRSWDVASIQVPDGVTIAKEFSSYEIFSPYRGNGLPVRFPIVVTEDSMLGVPISGLGRWMDDGPDADKVTRQIDSFLRRFDPRPGKH